MAFLDSASAPPPAPGLADIPVDGAGLPPLDQVVTSDLPTQVAPAQQQRPVSPRHQKLLDWSDHNKTKNIADELHEDELSRIGQLVVREYEIDELSRDDWKNRSEKAIAFASQVAQTKTTPWANASNVIYPLMTNAAIQFAARAYPAVVADRNVVKGVIYGDDNGVPMMAPDGTPAIKPAQQGQPDAFQGPDGKFYAPVWKMPPGGKRERADRIAEHMSYQLLDEQDEWDAETDKLLHILPIVGTCFRKSYFDPGAGMNISCLVLAQNLVINYKARSMKRAPRMTEIVEFYPSEIKENIASEIWLDQTYAADGKTMGDDKEAPITFLEQHRRLDLDGDGYPEPYIVTVHKDSNKVARIVARYDADSVHVSRSNPDKVVRIDGVGYYTKYEFMPSIDDGIYGTGLGQILLPINASVNTALNQLFDAGSLQNNGGGFIGKGVSMHGGSLKMRLGEWKTLNTPGSTIRDALVPLQHQGPSPVLFQLLGTLIQAGKDVSASNDVLEGSANMATMQPTTMLALIEQGLKVFTAIYKRIYRSLHDEFEKIYRLNRIYLEEQTSYQYGDEWKKITREDYEKGAGVCPYSDPKMVSDMQKMARAQLLLSLKDEPTLERGKIIDRVLEAGQIERAQDLKAKQAQPDPVMVATVKESEANAALAQARAQTEKAKEATERSVQVKNYAQGVLALATADEKEGDQDMAWITTQLAVMQGRLEMANGMAAPGTGGMTSMGALGKRPQMPQDEGTGEEAGEGEAPPVPGARKAPDGLWYAPDPERKGKYLRIMQQEAA